MFIFGDTKHIVQQALETDASANGLSAVLLQRIKKDNQFHPVDEKPATTNVDF